jgi:predicted dehydrogenase
MNTPAHDATPERAPSPSSRFQSRRSFLQSAGTILGATTLGLSAKARGAEAPRIQGFERPADDPDAAKGWRPLSDRKIRVGIAGYGVCQFGAAFGFQDHPNVEVVAVTDLFTERRDALARECRCAKTYPSLEDMVKDSSIEAVFVATDAPSHTRHCLEALQHGKHVATAVPAVFGSLEDADRLWAAVKSSGLKYMMFETSAFHADLHAMREIYRAGGLGQLVYAEGEYFHYMSEPIDSYKGWRIGLPPQWYPTHSNAYYHCVTGETFTKVSCLGMPSIMEDFKPANNPYRNPFGTEIALFHTSEGGMARMAVSWDTPGTGGEMGRIRGQRGSYYGQYRGLAKNLPDTKRPPVPPSVSGPYSGHHGGSHGPLMNEFVSAILQDRTPLVNIAMALNLTVAGIVAHQSALREGEWLKIPEYKL